MIEEPVDFFLNRLPTGEVFTANFMQNAAGKNSYSVAPNSIESNMVLLEVKEGLKIQDVIAITGFLDILYERKSNAQQFVNVMEESLHFYVEDKKYTRYFLADYLWFNIIGEVISSNFRGGGRIEKVKAGGYFSCSEPIFRGADKHFLVRDEYLNRIFYSNNPDFITLLKLQNWAKKNLLESKNPTVWGTKVICDLFGEMMDYRTAMAKISSKINMDITCFIRGGAVVNDTKFINEILELVEVEGD